ncbi:MAG: DUF4296 domain-containing protein [Prevotellaceae bacterium]|nr:DUF4296 domain-containing protein [Prevotellaceae bacterium]
MRKKLVQLLLLILAAAITACSPDKKIPESTLVKILVDIHMADAVSRQSSENAGSKKTGDSTTYYLPVLQKYGYTKEQLLAAMQRYGYSKDKARKLYGKVEKKLEKQEKHYKKERDKAFRKQDIWAAKDSYSLPQDDDTARLFFSVPVQGLGRYCLSAEFTLFSKDSVQSPHLTLYLYSESRDSIWQRKTIGQSRNGEANFYSAELNNDSPLATHVRGYLLDYNLADTIFAKTRHAKVQHVMLRYVPPPIRACD